MQFDNYQQNFIDFDQQENSVLLTQAVAGAGKSTTMAARIGRFANSSNIVAITFTNLAARDLKSKIRKFTNQKVRCSTIHKFFIDLLKSKQSVVVLSEWNALLVLREVITNLGYDFANKREATDFTRKIQEALTIYSSSQFETPINEFKILEYIEDFEVSNSQFIKIFHKYQEFKISKNMWDFNDLISDRVWSILDLEEIRNTIDELYIDEYQDLSLDQISQILKLGKNKKLVFVGDTDQQLYKWRFACGDILKDREFWDFHGFSNYTELNLLKNYRSTNNIVKFGNLIRQDLDGLQSESTIDDVKGSVKITKLSDNLAEGKFIASEIKSLQEQGVKLSDITILVRKNSYIKTVIEPALSMQGISYNIVSSRHKNKMWNSPITKILYGLISIFTDKSNILSFIDAVDLFDGIGETYKKQMIKRYFNSQTIFLDNPKSLKLKEIYNNIINLSSTVSETSEILGVISKLMTIIVDNAKSANLSEKKISLATKILTNYSAMVMEQNPDFSIQEIFETIIEDVNSFEEDNSNAVKVMTIHGSKGLSLPYVFVCDLTVISHEEDDGFIFYVANTRAEKLNHVVWSDFVIDRRFGRMKAKHNRFLTKTLDKLC